MKSNQRLWEFLEARLERENEFEKHAAADESCDTVVGNLSKGKIGRFAKTISFFLRATNENSGKVHVTWKRFEREWLQIPCNLHFTGDTKYIDKLKNILPTLL